MSFWSTLSGAKSNGSALPSAGSQNPAQSRREESSKRNAFPASAGPPNAAPPIGPPLIGPPPTATAYAHSSQKSASSQMPYHHQTIQTSTPIPTFHIFQPNRNQQDNQGSDNENDNRNVPVANEEIDCSDEPLKGLSDQPVLDTSASNDRVGDSSYAVVDHLTREGQLGVTIDEVILPPSTPIELDVSPPVTVTHCTAFADQNPAHIEQDVTDPVSTSLSAVMVHMQENEVDSYPGNHCESKESQENLRDRESVMFDDTPDNSCRNSDEDQRAKSPKDCAVVDDVGITPIAAINSAVVSESVVPSDTILAKVVSQNKGNRFSFLVSESMDPCKLEEDSTKRRRDFRTRFFQMDCRLAGLLSRCIKEGAERHARLKPIFSDACQELERVSNRYLGNKFMFDGERSRLLMIQSRVNKLHTKMVKHKEEDLKDLQDDIFESLHLEMLQNVQLSLQIEIQKADKRECTRFRKFEYLAGTVARRFHEETAARKASEVLLLEKIDLLSQPEKNVNFLEQLQTLRAELRQESEVRKSRDSIVLDDIHHTCDALKRAVLEAAGNSIE